MKNIKKYFQLILVMALTLAVSCDDQLEEKVYNSLTPSNFFQNDDEALASAYSIYASMNGSGWSYYGAGNENIIHMLENTTDVLVATAGDGLFYELNQLILNADNWSYNHVWEMMYKGISNSNYILEFLPEASAVDDNLKKNILAEAKVGLGLFYYDLVSMYGDVPLMTSYTEALTDKPSRAPKADVLNYLNQILLEAIPDLPVTYPSSDYGRFTKGAAQGLLMKIALMQKEWAKVDEYATAIINSPANYTLNPSYGDLFIANNTNESEFILSVGKRQNWNIGNAFLTYSMPGNMSTNGVSTQQWNGYRIRRDFYDTFDPDDIRRTFILTEYPDQDGGTVVLDPSQGCINVKYGLDPNTFIVFGENDIPIIRLADVLLAKAEALNQLNGPNQTSIDLINEVRDRAFNNDPAKRIALSDFGSKEAFNSRILEERGWELYFEGQRRTDLIRHGEFINKAIERGAQINDPTRELFPISVPAIDSNPNLLPNNPGYN